MAGRNSFIFYRSFYEALRTLSPSDRAILYEAIAEYAFNHAEIELPTTCRGMFHLIKPQIEANNRRYENGKKGAKHGVKGGRPKKETPMGLLEKTPSPLNAVTPNDNDNVNVNVNDKEVRGLRLDVFLSSLEEMKGLSIMNMMPDSFYDATKGLADDEKLFTEWEKFADYFINNADCKKPVKKDWLSAWRNWVKK